MSESLIPSKPVPECGQVFTKRVQGLLDGQPKDDETVSQALKGMDEMFDLIAAGLYSLASMLVGEGEDSIRLWRPQWPMPRCRSVGMRWLRGKAAAGRWRWRP